MAIPKNTEGIVIKMYNSKEADRVVHLMRYDGARQVFMAKGVKKSTSRKAHAIDLLNRISIKVVKGRGSLDIITEAKLVDTGSQYKKDYVGLMFAQAVCELGDIFIQEEAPEGGYYKNLVNLLEFYNPQKLALLYSSLALRYLYLSGDLPKLNEDVFDTAEISPGQFRYPTSVIGYTLESRLASGKPVPDRVFKAQRFILSYDFATIHKLELTNQEQMQMLNLHVSWLRILTNKEKPAARMFIAALLKDI